MITVASEFYEQLANKYGASVEEIRELLWFFWRDGVGESLNNLVSTEVFVSKLGSFKIKGHRVKYLLEDLKNWSTQESLYPGRGEYQKQALENLKLIEIKLDRIKEDKRNFDELHRKTSRHIQEQEQDLGRTQEQTI